MARRASLCRYSLWSKNPRDKSYIGSLREGAAEMVSPALHMVSIAGLAHRSRLVPRWIVAPVALAGAGYIVDAIGRLLATAYPFEVSSPLTFVGEVVLMGWLLWYGTRRPRTQSAVPASTAMPSPSRPAV